MPCPAIAHSNRTGAAGIALLGTLGDVDPDRIVFLDFDATLPVAFNMFDQPDEENYGRLTTEVVHSLKHLFGAEHFHRMLHILGNGVYGLFVLKANLASLPVLFAKTPEGDGLRRRVIAGATNAAVRRFWQDEFPAHRADAFAPIVNRLSALFLDDRTYRTFAQTENRVDVAQIMDTGGVLIVAPPASYAAAGIVGGMLIAQLKHAAFRRTGTSRAAQHFHLEIDEFHRFLSSAHELESVINECAKSEFSVGLANQETGQLSSDLLKSLYSLPNIFVFGVNLPDAKQLAQLFNGRVAPETLASQRTGEVYARIGQDIVNFSCPPPLTTDPRLTARLMADSLAKYHARTTCCAGSTAPQTTNYRDLPGGRMTRLSVVRPLSLPRRRALAYHVPGLELGGIHLAALRSTSTRYGANGDGKPSMRAREAIDHEKAL